MDTQHNTQNVFDVEYLVYIAGILIPSHRVGVSSAFNTPPTATIALPPYPELYGIGRQDRIPVQVFVKESWKIPSEFILLFEGEIESFSYSSTKLGRELVINAQGLLSILRDVNIKTLTSYEDIVQHAYIPGENNNYKTDTTANTVFPMSLFMYGISNVDTANFINTPTEFLENAYTFLQEPHEELKGQGQTALSRFYEGYTERIRLTDRFTELPYFDKQVDDEGLLWESGDRAGVFPLIDGMQKQAALQQITAASNSAMGLNRGPTQGSFYDLIDFIVGQMQYEFAFISSPRFTGEKLISSCLKPMFCEAVPPACNIIYRSMVDSVRTTEGIYKVPTRVRTSYDKGPMNMLVRSANSPAAAWGNIDYYPSEAYGDKPPPSDDSANWFAMELLDTEEYTGTFTHNATAPAWLYYVKPEHVGSETAKELRDKVLDSILKLKQFDKRRLQIRGAFNPYITPGFPGVVYDSEGMGFTFAGHVVSVSHELSKAGLATTVTMNFVRLLDEAIQTPLEHMVPKIDTLIHDAEKMSRVYMELLGCPAVKFEDLKDYESSSEEAFHVNPTAAYTETYREIVTLDGYREFMGLEVAGTMEDDDGTHIPTVLDGDFVTRRKDHTPASELLAEWEDVYADNEASAGPEGATNLEGIRWKLFVVASREFSNKIYD